MKILALIFFYFLFFNINAQCWKSISAGEFASFAIKVDGTLWAWGGGSCGQFGNGTINGSSNVPTQIGSSTNWKTLAYSSNGEHIIGLKTDGTIWGWGKGACGQLGTGTFTNEYSPVQIGTDTDWKSISVGGQLSIGLKNDGTMWAWGSLTTSGICTSSSAGSYYSLIPIKVGSDMDWNEVAVGYNHVIATKILPGLHAGGTNNLGQLGNNSTTSLCLTQTQTMTCSKLCANNAWSHIILSDGSLFSWGKNIWGQLGDGTNINRSTAVQSGPILSKWKSISAGSIGFAVAIRLDGTLWSWGYNHDGELGDGTIITKEFPVQIGTANDWETISCGHKHSLATKTDGTLWSWGYNGFGQLGNNTQTNSLIPILINCSTTSLNDNSFNQVDLNIYPNPAQNEISIDTKMDFTKLQIINNLGVVVLTVEKTNLISLKEMSTGLYFIQLLNKNNKVIGSKKFVKD